MEDIIEYETPINCLRRLLQQDNSDEFDLIIKFAFNQSKEFNIQTTINKARIISNKINNIYQVDPTITKYELTIPKIYFNLFKESIESQLNSLADIINLKIKSITEKISISKEKSQKINLVNILLGEPIESGFLIKMSSITEAISYLSSEFHDISIEYLSSHISQSIDEGQLFNLNDQIIFEIIDSYFHGIRIEKQENKNNSSSTKETKEIFGKLSKSADPEIVIHFLLQIESCKYTKEMCDYISEHISDNIASNELSQIVKQFLHQLPQEKHANEDAVSVEFQGDELKGIISHLKAKYGENICEKGEIKISDIGTHHHLGGSLLNLIKYDEDHINDHYSNNDGGYNPLPNENEGWIEFDFVKRKINLTSYTLRTSGHGRGTYHAKSWRIVGSNDRNSWELLDQQANNSSLYGKYLQHRFECENNHKYYRYIRYVQDDSWLSNREHNVFLTCVEFFGSLLTE